MKRITYAAIALLACFNSFAQKDQERSKLGLKGGYNWSYITGSEQGFKPENKNGFMFGGFFAPPVNNGMSYRTELVFSRQGYSFENGGQNTDVMNDYIYLPQVGTFNFTRFLQFHAGGQIGYLLNAKKNTGGKDTSITGLMNRIDYGFAAGIEINPSKAFTIGGRYNLGLGKMYKRYENASTNPYPLPFNPETTDFKNAVVQFYIGYRF
jgi:hypothetical protein